jgi:hypothetical protein
MYLQKVISKIKLYILKAVDEKGMIRIRKTVYGSKDPDPSHDVTDPGTLVRIPLVPDHPR